MSEEPEDTMHQLHINVPKMLYDKLRKILPDHGGVTSLVRNLLSAFVRNFENPDYLKESTFDKTVNEASDKVRSRKSIGEQNGT